MDCHQDIKSDSRPIAILNQDHILSLNTELECDIFELNFTVLVKQKHGKQHTQVRVTQVPEFR